VLLSSVTHERYVQLDHQQLTVSSTSPSSTWYNHNKKTTSTGTAQTSAETSVAVWRMLRRTDNTIFSKYPWIWSVIQIAPKI